MSKGARARQERAIAAINQPRTDPRTPGGDVAGPGGPLDRNAVVVDTTDAVLIDSLVSVLVHATSGTDEDDLLGLLLEGRINKTEDRSRVLYLLDIDGAVRLIAEVMDVYHRAGQGPAFATAVSNRLQELVAEVSRG